MRKQTKALIAVLAAGALTQVGIGPVNANGFSGTPSELELEASHILRYNDPTNFTGYNFAYDLYVCINEISEVTTPVQTDTQMPSQDSNCFELSDGPGAWSPDGTNISLDQENMYVNTTNGWVAVDGITHGSFIYMETKFFNNVDPDYWASSGPVQVDWVALSKPPEITQQPTLSISGDTVTVTEGAWSYGGAINDLMACKGNPIDVKTTPSTDMSPLFNCSTLNSTTSAPSPMPTDLSTAYFSFYDPTINGMAFEQFDPSKHGSNMIVRSDLNYGNYPFVNTASVPYGTSGGSSQNSSTSDTPFSAPAPFQGPVITAPSIPSSNAPGSTITIPGENLDGVSSVTIGDAEAEVVIADERLTLTIPATLTAGTYDLVISSSSGNVTISDAITVSGVAVNASEAPRGSTNREDDEVKIRVFNPAGAGKVQIIVNGKEIAWVKTDDPNDPKLFNGYLVRTVKLEQGKNVIEIFIDGERIRRNAYGL